MTVNSGRVLPHKQDARDQATRSMILTLTAPCGRTVSSMVGLGCTGVITAQRAPRMPCPGLASSW